MVGYDDVSDGTSSKINFEEGEEEEENTIVYSYFRRVSLARQQAIKSPTVT